MSHVVTDERAAEAVLRTVGLRPVHQTAVEEQHVPRPHVDGHRLQTGRRCDVLTREGHVDIRHLRAEQVHRMCARDDLKTAVVPVDHIARDPCRHARARLDPQIEVVLVQRLAPGPRRLEVEHALRGQHLLPEQHLQRAAQPGIEQHPQRQLVDLVRLHHPRVHPQRIALLRPGLEVPGHRPGRVQRREPLAQSVDLVVPEQSAYDGEALLPELAESGLGQDGSACGVDIHGCHASTPPSDVLCLSR